jgi:hypothetical protein
MNCEHCNKIFSNKHVLYKHQTTARYCLKIQNKEYKSKHVCEGCKKNFTIIYDLNIHRKKFKSLYVLYEIQTRINKIEIVNKERQNELQTHIHKIEIVNKEKDILIKKYETTIRDLQDKLENIAIKAVQKSSSTINNTKNIQINNFLKNAPMLTDAVIQDNIQYLTLDHHVQGAEGYAKYAMEFPFKGRIVCVDVSRNKIKYKDGDGNVIEDVGFQKMMMKLCKALYGKSYDLSIEHLDKLAKKFTEKELEQYDYLAAAKAIAMYSKGSESDFCRKVIKIISKSVTDID